VAAMKITLCSLITVFVASIYMPCDTKRLHIEDEEFSNCLNCIEQLMYKDKYDSFILCGDFNTCFSRNNCHTALLNNFMERNSLQNGWNHQNAKKQNTYVNTDLGHESCIDHFLLSINVYDTVCKCAVHESVLNPSSHHPIELCAKLRYSITEKDNTGLVIPQ
jgi:exonuclease III